LTPALQSLEPLRKQGRRNSLPAGCNLAEGVRAEMQVADDQRLPGSAKIGALGNRAVLAVSLLHAPARLLHFFVLQFGIGCRPH